MKFTIIFIFLMLISTIIQAQRESWKDYQCMLQKFDLVISKTVGECSGTFLNNNIFLTAAHCIDILSAGNSEDVNFEYLVDCPNLKDFVSVKNIAVHPNYFLNDEDLDAFNSTALNTKYLIDPQSFASLVKYNDIALLYTSHTPFDDYPSLETTSNNTYKNCSFLGFSRDYCHSPGGEGCLREQKSISPSDYGDSYMDIMCNLLTGENCYLRSQEKLRLPVHLQTEKPKFSHGDSGSGLICKVGNKNKIVGLIIGHDQKTGILSLAHKNSFISDFIGLNEIEFKTKSMNFSIENQYRKILQKALDIKRQLYPISRVFVGNQGIGILTKLENWILKKGSLINSGLERKKIKFISIVASGSENAKQSEKPFIHKPTGSYGILYIFTKSDIDDIENILF